MNEEQQNQLVRFLSLFAWMLKEGSASREQAEIILQAAASCMIGAVFNIGSEHPEAESIAAFIRRVIQTAIKLQYDPKAVSRGLQA